jgi:serine/threonine protein kinase
MSRGLLSTWTPFGAGASTSSQHSTGYAREFFKSYNTANNQQLTGPLSSFPKHDPVAKGDYGEVYRVPWGQSQVIMKRPRSTTNSRQDVSGTSAGAMRRENAIYRHLSRVPKPAGDLLLKFYDISQHIPKYIASRWVGSGSKGRKKHIYMENLRNAPTLTDYYIKNLKKTGSRGESKVTELADLYASVERAVVSMWLNGFFHADLHPGNILLQHDGTRLVTKIIDFGLAVPLDKGLRFHGKLREAIRAAEPSKENGNALKFELITDAAKKDNQLLDYVMRTLKSYEGEADRTDYNPDFQILIRIHDKLLERVPSRISKGDNVFIAKSLIAAARERLYLNYQRHTAPTKSLPPEVTGISVGSRVESSPGATAYPIFQTPGSSGQQRRWGSQARRLGAKAFRGLGAGGLKAVRDVGALGRYMFRRSKRLRREARDADGGGFLFGRRGLMPGGIIRGSSSSSSGGSNLFGSFVPSLQPRPMVIGGIPFGEIRARNHSGPDDREKSEGRRRDRRGQGRRVIARQTRSRRSDDDGNNNNNNNNDDNNNNNNNYTKRLREQYKALRQQRQKELQKQENLLKKLKKIQNPIGSQLGNIVRSR